MSTVIDQEDDTEVSTLSRSQVDIYFQNRIDTAGAEPSQEAAPSPEQVAAINQKNVNSDEQPYADFAVLTPLRRTTQR